MRILPPLLLLPAVLAAGCNPYVAAVSAVSQTYGVATDVRSLGTQASDTAIEARIKADLLQSPVDGTGSISVYCRQGVVVLTGVVPRGSAAGSAAAEIARNTSGVLRVETFYVDAQTSWSDDLEIKGQVKAALVADPNLVAGQVDIAVYNGHVVLIGVAPSHRQIERFVEDARDVDGVVSVRSFIQLPA